MADSRTRVISPIHKLRAESQKLFRGDELAGQILNMYPTEEGTLRSVRGPAPYLPDYSAGGAPASSTTANVVTPVYGPTRGVHHATLQGGARELLLLHTGTQMWVFEGWNRAWRTLIGPGAGALTKDTLEDVDYPQFPTLFVTTPTGVVIIPQDRRAYFYDGNVILPLGYSAVPGPPIAHGPQDSSASLVEDEALPGKNDDGYAHDALPRRTSGMHPIFRRGRLGTTVHPTNFSVEYDGGSAGTGSGAGDTQATVMGWLEPGEWRARTQWVDFFGNLSPLSGLSGAITVSRQISTGHTGTDSYYVSADLVRKQIAWEGIVPGPEGTVGRILHRTKDIIQTGDTATYEVPLNATAATDAFATLPDNESIVYPDNIPDSWLFRASEEVDPVPQFRVATLAFSRLWIANWPGDEGALRPSMVGRWGTFPSNKTIYPDPAASSITGLHASSRGLLVFTETSTYLVEANDTGEDFRHMPLSTRVGCVAPASIQTTRNGLIIWLGRDGFYSWTGSGPPEYLFEDNRADVKEFTHPRLKQAVAVFDERANEYRCWLSVQGSLTNNRCYTFDGEGWRRRTDVQASGVCVTADHRRYTLACGLEGSTDGLWVLDVETPEFTPTSRSHTVETGWISSEDSRSRTSFKRVYLWFRETQTSANTTPQTDNQVTVEFMRDWRETVDSTGYAELRPQSGVQPQFWNVATLNASGAKWRKRRPYWTKVDTSIPSCEVFKIRVTSTDNWEFVGFQFEESPRDSGGANVPP